ncbi:MAG: DUF4190 domain-containing protein [Kiritimatiellae bacterium]|nr:DUF4190 domain-containing protein [Kiritimatiellia bacterium]
MSFCKNCGNKIDEKAVICVKCGVPVQTKEVLLDSDNAAMRILLPVGRSGLAIAAGYVGLLSLLPFVGIVAILLGVLALRDIKSHPEKHGAGRAWFGIIMGGVFSLLYFILMIS